ncbi:MAG: hypothetical protein LBO09_03155 [Candidatus Peribacteria bacterium]|jgi:lipoprotein signal peptidase|nr:hypothetical protein [Candidatus Peribacteria bacterium]
MKNFYLLSFLFVVLLLGLDQLSKYFFYTQEIGANLSFLEPLFNTGISRGIAIPMLITLVISLVCVALFVFLFSKNYLTMGEFSLFIA